MYIYIYIYIYIIIIGDPRAQCQLTTLPQAVAINIPVKI